MTLAEAREALASIRNWNDAEVCHGTEDALLVAAVEAVVAGRPDALELCKVALEATQIVGPRWCA